MAPTTLSANKEYDSSDRNDEEGVEGTPYYRYVSTSSALTLQAGRLFHNDTYRLPTYQSEDVVTMIAVL